MKKHILFLGLLVFFILTSTSFGVIPKLINYQGMLTGSDGKTPVPNGNYSLTFKIYGSLAGADSLWREYHPNVPVTNGLFSIILGSITTLNLAFNTDYWLGIKVGNDPELSPRIRLTSVGYAYRASVADSAVASPPPSTGGGWTDDGTNVRLTTSTDKVGIGTSSPETYSKLHIVVPRTQTFDRVTIECPRDSNGFGIELKQPNGYWRLGQNVGNGWNAYFSISNNISPYYRLMILSDGKVGIGTSDPKDNLHVYGSNGAFVRIDGNTGISGLSITEADSARWILFYRTWQSNNLIVRDEVGNLDAMTFQSGTGNVGVGTSTPGAKLDVTTSSGGSAVRGTATAATGWGVEGIGKEAGAHFVDSDGSGNAYIGHGNTGVEGYGNEQGGYFQDADNGAYAHVGYGNRGIEAKGTEMGGYFQDSDGSGYASVGIFDDGIRARGNFSGGDFTDLNSDGWVWAGYDIYKVYGIGLVSFVQNHPYEKDRVITYTAAEGDEAATYTRGTSRLVAGEARVTLGETFKWVTNPDIGLTAHLTPRGDCKGLYVASLTTSEMVVKELQGGTSDATFDYLVYGLRIGFEEASVVQEKIREAYIPSLASHRERYNTYPELRHFNALERFKEMNAQIGKPVDLGASRALRDAIHEFDPAIDKLPEPADHK